MRNRIDIKNAHIHNLKGVNVSVPKYKLTVITGVSGSGKSSLAFDTLYEEGRKRYLMFSGAQIMVEKESVVDEITGLSPTVAVEQRIIRQSNPRSTVGTRTQIQILLASLFAGFGVSDPGYEPKEPLKAQMFQKNSPRGMCPKCMGKGHYYVLDEERLLPDKNIRVDSLFNEICDTGMMWRYFEKYRRTFHATTDKKFSELTEEEYNNLMYEEAPHYEGLALWLPKVYEWGRNSATSWCRKIDCVDRVECKRCEGRGLSREAAHTRIGKKTITELEGMYISDLYSFLNNLPGEKSPLQKELEKKLACLSEVGLHHLSLSRTIPSLSGGEIQRLFLASYILAVILSRVAGDCYDFIKDRLYNPLGIKSDRWFKSPDGIYYSVALDDDKEKWSDLCATDMLKLGILFLNDGIYDGKSIISKEYIDMAVSPSKLNPEYGFLWWIGDGWYGCRGYGGQSVTVFPADGRVVVTQARVTNRPLEYNDVISLCKK